MDGVGRAREEAIVNLGRKLGRISSADHRSEADRRLSILEISLHVAGVVIQLKV